jgi:hypothetical protein
MSYVYLFGISQPDVFGFLIGTSVLIETSEVPALQINVGGVRPVVTGRSLEFPNDYILEEPNLFSLLGRQEPIESGAVIPMAGPGFGSLLKLESELRTCIWVPSVLRALEPERLESRPIRA